MTTLGDTPSLGLLIEKTQNLLANFEIPIRTRSLPEILPITKHMAEEHDVNFDVDALMFFAKRGLDITKQQELLQSLSTQQTQATESIETVIDWDVDRWMETQQSQLISAAIEECDVYNNISFQDYFITSLDHDWVNLKRELLESMDVEVPKISSVQDSVVPEFANLQGITPEQELYGKAVEKFNYVHRRNASLGGDEVVRLSSFLLDASKEHDSTALSTASFEVVELWSVLESISAAVTSNDPALRTQQTVQGACAFLHSLYVQHVVDTLTAEGSLSEEETHRILSDSVLSADTCVRLAALYVRSSQFYNRIQSVSTGGYQLPNTIWAQAYVCLRMGDALACRSVLSKASLDCGSLLVCLNSFEPGLSNATPLGGSLADAVHAEFVSVPLDVSDPFRGALYQLAGRLGDDAQGLRSRIATFTRSAFEDFLWQKLVQVDLSGREASARAALGDQADVLVRNLQASGAGVLQIARVYLLTMQFERAVHEQYAADSLPGGKMLAAHLALALASSGLLSVSDSEDVRFTPTASGVNVSRLLMLYTRGFKAVATHSVLVLHYLYALSTLSGPVAVVQELTTLLSKDSQVVCNLLQAKDLSRWSNISSYKQSPLLILFGEDTARQLCRSAAASYLERGLVETAISLYYLSTEYLVMGIVLLTLLCKAISEQDLDKTARMTEICRQFYGLFHQGAHSGLSTLLSAHDIYSLSGTKDARLNDVQFVCSCIRIAVSIGDVVLRRQHLQTAGVSSSSLQKLLVDITALKLLPTSYNHVEWNMVHHTIEQLPECIQSLISLLVLEYYHTLSDYANVVRKEEQEATRVGNSQSLTDCKAILLTIKEQSAVLYQFMTNRFSTVSSQVCAIISVPL